MYTLSAAFWAYSIAYVVGNMQAYINPQNEQWLRFSNQVSPPLPLFHAIVLVNVCLSFLSAVLSSSLLVVCSQRWNSMLEGMGDFAAKLSSIYRLSCRILGIHYQCVHFLLFYV